ncbi:E3 ubiquitin-protein ligase rnf213-alpha-like [Watersipora subatra]|uniref:E3 ubiquitin-protein ligase rnf213-alpha-like n=1 Tax=Watersipora subatra TaxID=2589382 RepID=UPI00355BDE6C
MTCESCDTHLSSPYHLVPCHHYIGKCCGDRMTWQQPKTCPKKDCGKTLDEDFQWQVDETALKHRQYFENSNVTSSFIGYSSEMGSLIVKQTSEEVAPLGRSYGKLFEEIYERSKKSLVECCAAESILRLDRTILSEESEKIQKWYMEEQQHENFLQYVDHQMSLSDDQSLLIQATTFAELMNKGDIASLQKELNDEGKSCDVQTLFLRDYQKESLFTNAIRKFYSKQLTTVSRLLIIQCEAAHENIELLDSVRYIIQREISSQCQKCHTVLLLSLSRGHPFSGYQGGKWKCVHIDDPKPPAFKLLSVSYCMQIQPKDLIGRVLSTTDEQPSRLLEGDQNEAKDPVSTVSSGSDRDNTDDRISRSSSESFPPQAGSEETYLPVEQEVFDTEPVQSKAIDELAMTVGDLAKFLEHCLFGALSIINFSPSDGRVAGLKFLLTNKDTQRTFLTHLYTLLKEQDDANVSVDKKGDWVKFDAAKASNMKKSETIRHAIEDSLERAFRPALAAIITFIDPQHNIQLLNSSKENVQMVQLWLSFFSKADDLGLNFESLTKVADGQTPSSRLPKSYKVHEAGSGTFQVFQARFPFSWLVRDTIERVITASTHPSFVKGIENT